MTKNKKTFTEKFEDAASREEYNRHLSHPQESKEPLGIIPDELKVTHFRDEIWISRNSFHLNGTDISKMGDNYSPEQQEQIAAEIVRRYNSMEGLYKALEALIKKMESSMLTSDIEYYRVEKHRAKQALKNSKL